MKVVHEVHSKYNSKMHILRCIKMSPHCENGEQICSISRLRIDRRIKCLVGLICKHQRI